MKWLPVPSVPRCCDVRPAVQARVLGDDRARSRAPAPPRPRRWPRGSRARRRGRWGRRCRCGRGAPPPRWPCAGRAGRRAAAPARRLVRTAIMPQPMSTPTAAGMIARRVAITLPTVAPLPRCTSGITATWRWMKGSRAMRSSWARASASNGTPTVQARMGLPLGHVQHLVTGAVWFSASSWTMASAPAVPAAAPDQARSGPRMEPVYPDRLVSRYYRTSMSRRRLTVIGFLGVTLDQAKRGPSRWEKWRPTVSLCQHEDLLVDRLVLLYSERFKGLADYHRRRRPPGLARDRGACWSSWRSPTPGTWRRPTARSATSPAASPWTRPARTTWCHITTGTHIAQICHVPAGGVAPLPRPPDPDLARPGRPPAPRRAPASTASSTSICRSTTASPAASRRSAPRGSRS